MANRVVIFDTSIFIDHLRTNKHVEHFEHLIGLIRNSSVVLSELARGATHESELDFVSTLAKNHPILTPTERNWLESGSLLYRLREDKGFSSAKLRDLHFDVLIALTARNHGATVISSNQADFEQIRHYKEFHLEIW
jgi:predicted nucleic acid-binding protein